MGIGDALMLVRNEVERAMGREPRTTPDAIGLMIERGLKGKDPFTGE
jgi:hypothetical protein